MNANCTNAGVVRDTIESFQGVDTWIIFEYAEPGYHEELKAALEPLARSHRFIMEEDVEVSPDSDGDNYFVSMTASYIMQNAPVFVDTHICNGRDKPWTRNRKHGTRHFSAVDSLGVCSPPSSRGRHA
mmetsp:Transcript_8771/g.23800  ORF Transcript_8771/g.23800 Transcript_8771/m.23800 type:complete len:128 (-) Transcript_8771:33-416(-)